MTDTSEIFTTAGTAGIDPQVLHRIRSLLSKAESSSYPEEAAAFTAKAHELMARYAIEAALLEDHCGTGQITSVRLLLQKPYVKEKFHLVSAVAQANTCRAILGLEPSVRQQVRSEGLWHQLDGGEPATLLGYQTDLEVVELLFTSLLLQAVNIMVGHGSQKNAWGDNRTRSFRRSFLLSFAQTIHERLEDSRDRATQTAQASTSQSVLPVLANRKDRVDQHIEETFPNLGTLTTAPHSNAEGLRAGRSAGYRADIGTRGVQSTAKGSLPR